MRSSVTVMFSNPPSETTMSYPDYKQKAKDHGSMLVLVKHIGRGMPSKSFHSTFERVSRLQHIRVPESQTGGQRSVWVRYKRNYAIENNEWGDFQAHRKVLGLICIGKCDSQDELDNLCEEHEKIRERYLSTLYDSRCIVFGSSSPSTQSPTPGDALPLVPRNGDCNVPLSMTKDDNEQNDDDDCVSVASPDSSEPAVTLEAFPSLDGSEPCWETRRPSPLPVALESSLASPSSDRFNSYGSSANSTPSPMSEDAAAAAVATLKSSGSSSSSSSSSHCPKPFLPPQNLKTTVLYYADSSGGANVTGGEGDRQLERDLYEFICSLFWVLESKRLDRSHEKVDRLPLLYAPFERKDFVGLDMDSRTNKKRCAGRMKKHIGDLCLLAGLPAESIGYYNAAADQLKSANDWLWLAGCFEGLCAASVILLFPENRRPSSLQRNSSFTAGAIPTFAVRPKPSGFSSLPNGLDPAECRAKSQCLSPNEIVDKYREAIGHYRKYHSAAVIETEASVKACQVLIHQDKYLLASDFLQNVVSINIQLSEEEKIRRFSELSRLYKMIGFRRKAAFYKRVAAMRCVTPKLPDPDWSECYHLLLQTLDGYNLSLDPKTVPKDRMCGWPTLQIQILQELVATSRRMGSPALSVRHMTFLLHVMFDHLSASERREFAAQLESLTARCEGGPVPLALDTGLIIPPVNLIDLPRVKSFKLQNLASHLQPIPMVARSVESAQCGPFIFSPLQLNVREKNKNSTKMSFKWVEGDVCEVALQVYNPLPFELRVTNMGLLPDGIAFETFPTCLSLPPESGPHPVNLLGTPRSTGELFILGYTTHVLGVKSDCRLKDVPTVRKPRFTIDVVPALPQVQVVTSLPKSPVFPASSTPASFSSTSSSTMTMTTTTTTAASGGSNSVVTSAHLALFAGESCDCMITLVNTGKEDVESLEVQIETKLDRDLEKDFCVWNLDEIKSRFPVRPDESASFPVTVRAVGDFLPLNKANDEGSDTSSLFSSASQMAKSRATSTAVTSSSTTTTGQASRTNSAGGFGSSRSSFTYSSFRGKLPDFFVTAPRQLPSSQSPTHHQPPKSQMLEAILKVRYSGGPGLEAGYCRQCLIAFTLEVVPSVVVVKWDVLPAESAAQCYLVLDVLNATDHEMEMQYAPQKQILIEARNTCRIPVPVQRCPLAKLAGLSDDESERACREHVASLVTLDWSISGTETVGRASVSSITWNAAMLDVLKMCPLQWDVSLNGEPYGAEKEFSFAAGQIVDVVVGLSNHSGHTMSDLNLVLQCHQDYQNAQVSSRVDGKLLVVGTDKVFIRRLFDRDAYRHRCGLLFFYPGVYKLDVQCRSLDRLLQAGTSKTASTNRSWRSRAIEIVVTTAAAAIRE